ncbi:MAG TPA: hypothetical protein VIL30_17050 [Ramlibacter sp.]|jgi:hypothetical protein
MEWIATGLVALAIGLPALAALVLLVAGWRLTRLRWRRSPLGLAAPGAVPPEVRATLDDARPLLAALGFEFRYTTAAEPALASDPTPLVLNDVYQHTDKRTHAVVTPAPAHDPVDDWSVMWVTQLRSGHVLATVNCYLHNLVAAPSGWVMDDGYLPDAQQSWQRHLQRLPANVLAIVTDGVEFFHANKQAVDNFIPQCEKRGLMAQRGDWWHLRWTAAIVFACKLYFGRRKAAKARVRASSRPGSPGSFRNAQAS